VTANISVSHGSALLAFRAQNVRSFRDKFELSMVATALAEKGVVRRLAWREGGHPVEVLPVAALYGANASGKTNVLRAMDDMRSQVLHSFRGASPTGRIPRHPFRFDASREQPSQFEIDFILDGVRHEYGFVMDDEHVIEEWAYRYPRGRAALLFRRQSLEVEFGLVERSKGRAVKELLRPNALFLSTAASANHSVLLPIYEWFGRNLQLVGAGGRHQERALTMQMLEGEKRAPLLELLRAVDLGITGVRKKELPPVVRERVQRALRVLSGQEEDGDDKVAQLDLDQFGVSLTHRGAHGDVDLATNEESLGTLMWFALIGPIVDALANGSVFLADELDASLHPALVAEIVALFQNPLTNPHVAQMVFCTHDVTLLGDATSDRLLGRDQVWFTEKFEDGATRLYPLADLDPRKQEAISKRYLDGRYGAIPILSREQLAGIAEMVTAGSNS
jgi:uncharacterized protein